MGEVGQAEGESVEGKARKMDGLTDPLAES